MLPDTADLIELIWTLAAALGLLGAAGVAIYAYGDWRGNRAHPQLDRRERARRHIVATTVLRNRLVSVYLQLSFVVLGVRAITLPQNPDASDGGAFFAGAVVLTASLAVSANSMLDLWGRWRFRHLEGPQRNPPRPSRARRWLKGALDISRRWPHRRPKA